MDFISTDGTHYQSYVSQPYELIRVISSEHPNLKSIYNLLNALLLRCFQPISFGLYDGVYVKTPIAEGFLQAISEEENGLALSMFGVDHVIHIASSEPAVSLPQEVLLEPALSVADQTSYFNLDNDLHIGSYHLQAWIDSGEASISIQGSYKANVKGYLVAYNDEFITVRTEKSCKTFSLNSAEFNAASNMLPPELNIFWSEEQNGLILAGVKFLKTTTPLHLHDIQLQSSNDVELTVSTLANPGAKFVLQLKPNLAGVSLYYDGQHIQDISNFEINNTWRYI